MEYVKKKKTLRRALTPCWKMGFVCPRVSVLSSCIWWAFQRGHRSSGAWSEWSSTLVQNPSLPELTRMENALCWSQGSSRSWDNQQWGAGGGHHLASTHQLCPCPTEHPWSRCPASAADFTTFPQKCLDLPCKTNHFCPNKMLLAEMAILGWVFFILMAFQRAELVRTKLLQMFPSKSLRGNWSFA